MKPIFLIAFFCILSCKSQSPIVGLDARMYNTPDGAYYKDLNNELDKFVGTWKFTGNNSEFNMVLGKIEQMEIMNDYRDYLKGEYSYIENGSELVNTLPLNLSSNDNNVGGSYIIDDNNFLSCDDCSPNERRIKLFFKDPERDYLNLNMVIRYMVGSSPEQIQVIIYSRHGGIVPSENSPTTPRVPLGSYLMTKQ
ncbi:hypothetical protein M0G43_07970 [Subsaxibacter sp. CAU 1640]|uniref:DUF6705 family protein n=1 Tax=Subsaxibacter sp. CAU 1640 TaxID=2933271 RepID=UPI002003C639|nr:DUF6705 family protein [Subsaxibacter sp. CAU 1640]MCK7590504.1 hypothetical protein [Subsaxibacter sp. CAU 1640]